MQRIRFLELAGAPTAPLVLATLTLLLSAGLPGSAGGADTDALYRALGGRPRDEKASNSAPSEPERAADAKSAARAEFHERIKPYLSSGGYYSLFRAARVAGEGAVPSGLPQAIAPESPNVQVNDSRGEVCGSGCTQSETSIAVSGTDVVIGFNDSRGLFDGTDDISGYAYSVNGGMTWTDGGALPVAGGGDGLSGDPAVVSCNGSFYYASLYRTGCGPGSGARVEETEPNDGPANANRVSLGDDYGEGVISPASDVDFVAFFAPAGTVLQATTVLGTLSDSILVLFDVDGTTRLAFNDDFGGSLASQIVFTIPADGTYYIAVGGFAEGSYTLQIRSCPGQQLPRMSAVSVSSGSFMGSTLRWKAPVVAALVPEPEDFLDKDYIACDPSTGTLYVSYTHFPFSGLGTGQIELVRSTDGGTTWSPATVVDPEGAELKTGAVPAVGPGGEVYVVWVQGVFGTSLSGKPTIQLGKSMDGSETFPIQTQVAEFVETTSNPPLGLDRILDFPSVAVDRSAGPNRGNLYVAFEEADRDVRDIKLARSTNGGRDFEPVIRVNDDPPGAEQFFPSVAVDPTDGQISVVSYDRRRHPRLALTDVFLSQSNDGGLTFVPGVALTDRASSFLVNADARPVFGDYINVTADGKAIYATWADGRNGDPDVFFARIKIVAPFVLLRSSSLDDSAPSGDGDGAPEPVEQPRLKVALANIGSGPATGVSATLRTNTPGVTVSQNTSSYPDLSGRGSVTAARALYQFRVDPSLTCSKTVVCSPITTQLYGVDPVAGTIVRFAFDTGTSGSVPAPGDTPSGGPDGLAVKSPTDAFWVNGFGLDRIFEFNPMTGELIETGPFPIRSPGMPMCTDALALVSPNRLFTQNFCEEKLYEVDTTTGLIVNASLPGGLGVVGGLAGGAGRLFATLGLRAIAELDPDSGDMLNEFAVPDLSGDGAPDRVFGLAFDGTYLFAASVDADPPNVMALDPATAALLGVSPFVPSRRLSALDAVAGPLGEVCKAGTFRTLIDFDLDITTDQGTFSSSLTIPLGREAKTTAFRDDVEAGVNGWTATGEWHQTTDRSVGAGQSWYFGRENGPPLGNAYDNNAAGDLTSPPFNLSGASSAELVFDTYLARELCCDFATVSASADGFATSTLLGSLDPSVDPAFSEVRLDLSMFAGKRAVQVRFTFMSDASVAFEGWYVDNIRVEQMTFDCQANTAGSQLCSTDADCDDGNPGTADQCAGGACVHPCAQGFAGADCALREALMSPLCQSERIDPQLERLIESKLTTADALVGRAQLTNRPTRARSIIRRADRALATISRRARTAKKARRISAACAQTIENQITDLRRRVMALRR